MEDKRYTTGLPFPGKAEAGRVIRNGHHADEDVKSGPPQLNVIVDRLDDLHKQASSVLERLSSMLARTMGDSPAQEVIKGRESRPGIVGRIHDQLDMVGTDLVVIEQLLGMLEQLA